jgi:tRNA(Ile)-lysidine synthase
MSKGKTNIFRNLKPRLSSFASNLLAEWRSLELPVSEVSVVVAVSGGSDSTALLLGLDELVKKQKLHLKLTVAHLDHGLRDESEADAHWVRRLGKELDYDVVTAKAHLKKSTPSKGNLEQAARTARYKFFLKTAKKNHAKLVLTAHTLDDQAETILLRLLRGSAAEGLSGIPAVRDIEPGANVRVARPLLSWARRSDTEDYCRRRQIEFRVDEMNHDEAFARVRVRKQLLPLMKSFNNRVVEALSRTATLLGEDAVALSDEAGRLLEMAAQNPNAPSRTPTVREESIGKQKNALANAQASAWTAENSETKSARLSVSVLLQAPVAVRSRALREWILRYRGDLKRLERVHLVAVERLLEGDRGGRVAELPAGMIVTRKRGMLELSRKKKLKKAPATPKIPRG